MLEPREKERGRHCGVQHMQLAGTIDGLAEQGRMMRLLVCCQASVLPTQSELQGYDASVDQRFAVDALSLKESRSSSKCSVYE